METKEMPTDALTLKEYYENFKHQLSDGDFSDCELLDDTTSDEEEEEEYLDPNVGMISEYDDPRQMATKVEPEKENRLVKKQKANIAKTRRESKLYIEKKSLAAIKKSSAMKIKRVYARPELARELMKELLKNDLDFKCSRCSKGFKQESFLKQHLVTPAACDRQLAFMERQLNIKKAQSVKKV
jgi:hypothetical protein